MTDSPGVLAAGSHFGGDGDRYRVEELVGEGAQGLVYRVFDTRLERPAAAKLSLAAAADAGRVRQRFERELRYASRFSHPRILQVFDAGELPAGAPWVVLEWMATGSLQHVLEEISGVGRRLPLRYVKYYGLCIAEALDAVHRSGLVHGDVKPANVLISGSGETKLGDFGVTAEWTADAPSAREVVGTPGFMAPEQLAGRAEPGSDLFALGACVFVMLVGRVPLQTMRGDRPTGVVQRAEFKDVPQEFEQFLRRCLASDRSERFADAAEAGRALLSIDARGDGRQRLARSNELPPEPQGGLRATGEEGEGDLLFELVDDTQAHPAAALPAGRTISPPPRSTGATVGATAFDDRGMDSWLRPDSRLQVGLAAGLVVVILAAFTAAWLLRPPPAQDVNALVVSCEEALLGGVVWVLPESLSLSALAKSESGQLLQVFAALSTDEGKSWEIKRLITEDGPPRTIDGGGATGRFTMSATSAEPRGYLSICQTPNGVIHLISSKQHYAFNLAWLNTPPPAPPKPVELEVKAELQTTYRPTGLPSEAGWGQIRAASSESCRREPTLRRPSPDVVPRRTPLRRSSIVPDHQSLAAAKETSFCNQGTARRIRSDCRVLHLGNRPSGFWRSAGRSGQAVAAARPARGRTRLAWN